MLTAEQKIRQTLTGDPFGEPHFQHEGPDVVRKITGGTLPDVYVTFHKHGEQIEMHCATCKNILGSIPAHYDREATAQELARVRLAGHEHAS